MANVRVLVLDISPDYGNRLIKGRPLNLYLMLEKYTHCGVALGGSTYIEVSIERQRSHGFLLNDPSWCIGITHQGLNRNDSSSHCNGRLEYSYNPRGNYGV